VTTFATITASIIATILIAAYASRTGAAGIKSTKKSVSTQSNATTNSGGPLYATRADVMAMADDIAQRRGLDTEWVRNAVGQSRYMPFIAKAITPPPAVCPKPGAVPQPFY
jgi:membrane-bound lytic murein transglycosylase B